MFEFEVIARDPGSRARAGRFVTPHGVVETPAFMPVGTRAAVKTVDPQELEEVGAQMILSNAYHLSLQPGGECIERLGGIHRFMGWNHPILTDSGGFQIWSLSARDAAGRMVRIDDDGVTFRSHLDGSVRRLTPETAVDLQLRIGADVIMALDECTPIGAPAEQARLAAARTHQWARRCRDRWLERQQDSPVPQALFGIVQGGDFRDLRRWSTETIAALDLPGIAIGGQSIGYSKTKTAETLEWIEDLLPTDRPRYAMGIGDPLDFLIVIERGIDLFDSVYPTRLARNGALLTSEGRLRITAVAYRSDERPVDAACQCTTCRTVSRAYLHHLFRSGELAGHRLATIHNLAYCLKIVARIREAIRVGRLEDLRARWPRPPATQGEDQRMGMPLASSSQ
jgi:queuine tRNA-ribosyltransferase